LAGKNVKFEALYDEVHQDYRIKIVQIEHGNRVLTTLDGYFVNSGDYSKIVKAHDTVDAIAGANLTFMRGEASELVSSLVHIFPT
jgi:DNA gyrase subunit B